MGEELVQQDADRCAVAGCFCPNGCPQQQLMYRLITYKLDMGHQAGACLYVPTAGRPGLQPDASASRKSWQLCCRETVLVRCKALLAPLCWSANLPIDVAPVRCVAAKGNIDAFAGWLMQVPKRG